MKVAYAVLLGEKIPFHALVPVFPITKETLENYQGWLGPVAEDFTKPWKSDSPKWRGSLKILQN